MPGHRIPREEGRLTFLGRCSLKTYERGRLRGVHFLTGRNGEREGEWGRGAQGNLIYLQFNKKMEPDCDVKLNQNQLSKIKARQLYLPFFLFLVLVLSSSCHLYLLFLHVCVPRKQVRRDLLVCAKKKKCSRLFPTVKHTRDSRIKGRKEKKRKRKKRPQMIG